MLGAIDHPAPLHRHRPGAQVGKVRAGVRLAEANAEENLPLHQTGQEGLALGFGAVAEKQRSALAIAGPVQCHRGAGGEHFLKHHEAFEGAPLAAAVALGPSHADPAPLPHLAAEGGVRPMPGGGALGSGPGAHLLGNEVPNLEAQVVQ